MATRSKAKSVSSTCSIDDDRATSSQGSLNETQNDRVQTGHGPQLVVEEQLPAFDDKMINWEKYAMELQLHIMDQNEDEDIRTSSFTPKRNREIYRMLIRGVGQKSFELISKTFEFKGQEAFLFLEENYLGTKKHKRKDFPRSDINDIEG